MSPMRGRRIGRRVVRTAATTAVVVGTAAVVGGAIHGSQQQPAPQAAPEPEVVYVQEPAAPAALPAAAPEVDVMAQLTQYSKMHDAGVITDEEFAAVKAKLLGI